MRISDKYLKTRLIPGYDELPGDGELIWQPCSTKGLEITPVPKLEDITGITVDVHLDNEFQVIDKSRTASAESTPIDLSGTKESLAAIAAECFKPHSGPYVLQPGEFCLGCTAEVIKIPKTLVGWLDGRSTLARFGLLVHVTAHRVDPGWNGKVVLEFYNAGAWPLRLQPGMKIGAMSFEEINGRIDVGYGDRADASYQNQQSVVLPGGGK